MATGKATLSKEAKTALKAAREAIKNKEYKEAIKQCKVCNTLSLVLYLLL